MPKRANPEKMATESTSAKERHKKKKAKSSISNITPAESGGTSTSSNNAGADTENNSTTDGKERFTFFYSNGSPFSQWYPCVFSTDGKTFNCAEQYMMYQKAVLFGDNEMAKQIMATDSPKKQKGLGRKVSNFKADVWGQRCRKIVFDGNYLKFTQNEDLKPLIMATKGTTIVEASPRDKIWGIGMGANNPLAQNRATWKGRNYLGEALTQVREKIQSEDK